jgi:polysaccharide biosynthesis protein PslH
MDYYPNEECMVAFCADVLPLIRAERPAIRLLIVGAEPSAGVRKLGDLPGVTVTGSVPDVRPYVRGSALTVAPLNIARGTQNKILEAMAMGVPVVTSSIAARGVDAEAEKHFLVADTPKDYARKIVRILSDRVERQRLAEAGRARMLSHHTWNRAMQRLDGIIERCLSGFQDSKSKHK